MLYKFQSRAAATIIMLEAPGRQLLHIMGKEAAAHGIITAAHIPQAIAALQAAIAQAETAAPAQDNNAETEEDMQPTIGLRQRATPFLDMLRRSSAAGRDVYW